MVGDAYNVSGVPETFIIDRKGRIVAHHMGAFDWSQTDVRQALNGTARQQGGLAGNGQRPFSIITGQTMAILKKHKWSISVAIGAIVCLMVVQEVAVRRAQASA